MREVNAPPECPLIDARGHTAARIRPVWSECITAAARIDGHAILPCPLNDKCPELHALCVRDITSLGKVAARLGIAREEADDDHLRLACQPLCHCGEHRPVPRQRMMCVKDDRVVAPPDGARSESRRELMKGTHNLLPWRHIGLNIPAVWRDGNVPELPERREEIHIGKHRCGILRAEADEVNHARVNAIACHLMHIVGITDTDLARTQPIHQPRRIERRNIRALPCVEYHRVPPPLFTG